LFAAFAREAVLQPAFVERALPLGDDRVATPLPIRFVGVGACAFNRWMPRMMVALSTGAVPTAASVAASTTKAAPATPAAPS
jgi:hypothetical protein